MAISDDEYQKKSNAIKKQIEKAEEDFKNIRIDLEHQYDEELAIGNKILEEHHDEYSKFRTMGQQLVEIVDNIEANPKGDIENYPYTASDAHEEYQARDKEFQDREKAIIAAIDEYKRDYQAAEDEVQADLQSKTSDLETQLEELEEERNKE